MILKSLDSLRSINDIHEWLNRCAFIFKTLDHNEQITVDLSNLQWVSPLGNATLICTLHKLNSRYGLKINIPENGRDEKVIGYMERMDFFKICPPLVKSAFDEKRDMASFYQRNRYDQTNGLFELREAKEYGEIGSLQSSVREIMKNKLQPNRISDIARIVGELAGNSIEHGGTACFPCVQYYPHLKKVEIAICDYGKGIVKSLRGFVPHSNLHEVVEKAILTDASSVREEDRGRGLIDVKNRTFGWSEVAEFYVRTHNSAYRVFPNKVSLLKEGDYFFGTHYYIVINVA
ncbi:ATP-binding protein [Paenibacillus fonticola]|uniref:ATP-binding protein n=1 Tax=Paenibacillus fonticola TaxID=379896 RepID=UPI0003762528|nr:ATP-binding protein [Paenibacillus fonticola]